MQLVWGCCWGDTWSSRGQLYLMTRRRPALVADSQGADLSALLLEPQATQPTCYYS